MLLMFYLQSEKAKRQWDGAVWRNALKMKSEIEAGTFIPEHLKKKLEAKRKAILKDDKLDRGVSSNDQKHRSATLVQARVHNLKMEVWFLGGNKVYISSTISQKR